MFGCHSDNENDLQEMQWLIRNCFGVATRYKTRKVLNLLHGNEWAIKWPDH